MKVFYLILVFLLVLPSEIQANSQWGDSVTSIASPTLEIDFPSGNSLIQFFRVTKSEDRESGSDIEMYLTSPATGSPRSYYLGKIEPQGDSPNIESVFTLDVDRDGRKELLIIARWEISHLGLETEGNYYKTYVYKAGKDGLNFTRMKDVESVIGEGLDGTREGKSVYYRYRNAESIRKLFRKP
ncbi:hypothetical protein [Pseudoxanthomonas putridarboris]|uniref:Uncharacterized protein n=1 Tax=Pseudoxanthomonas putridarboris TaxID=752605 RepID=A0ABU9J643_9GAMM